MYTLIIFCCPRAGEQAPAFCLEGLWRNVHRFRMHVPPLSPNKDTILIEYFPFSEIYMYSPTSEFQSPRIWISRRPRMNEGTKPLPKNLNERAGRIDFSGSARAKSSELQRLRHLRFYVWQQSVNVLPPPSPQHYAPQQTLLNRLDRPAKLWLFAPTLLNQLIKSHFKSFCDVRLPHLETGFEIDLALSSLKDHPTSSSTAPFHIFIAISMTQDQGCAVLNSTGVTTQSRSSGLLKFARRTTSGSMALRSVAHVVFLVWYQFPLNVSMTGEVLLADWTQYSVRWADLVLCLDFPLLIGHLGRAALELTISFRSPPLRDSGRALL
ncbi:hypothetical protein K438DRAFT_2122062 [Mycena galopus ATCC 62051]|nr:hypothetical protein K438DRAFT_2122062 [Mycena galopus ATCC 62051]